MLEHIANAKKSGMKLNDYFKEDLHLKILFVNKKRSNGIL